MLQRQKYSNQKTERRRRGGGDGGGRALAGCRKAAKIDGGNWRVVTGGRGSAGEREERFFLLRGKGEARKAVGLKKV